MPKAIVLLAAVFFLVTPASAETLTFAPLPMESPETVASQWKPLLAHLEKALGVALVIDYSTNNQRILDKFKAGLLDLAYLGALPHLLLKDRFPAAQPVVILHEANGQPFYTCALVARDEDYAGARKLPYRKPIPVESNF